jgi:DnaJ-class molecular chaperone
MNEAELLTNLHILELEKPTSKDKIQQAYRRLVKIHHPDRGGVSAQFIAIKQAYENLLKVNESHLKSISQSYQQEHSDQKEHSIQYINIDGFVQDDSLYWREKDVSYYEPENPTMVGFFRASRARDSSCQKCVGSGIITRQTANPGGMTTLEEFLCECQKLKI